MSLPDHMHMRLSFAERRMSELFALNSGDLIHADEHQRQQLIQEFFFHLVGAIEELAQFVNEKRKLGISSENVSIPNLVRALPSRAPLTSKLMTLHKNTRGQPLPADPYSEDGYLFRLYNYRNQVAHRGRNPWNFTVGLGSDTANLITLQLDPRGPNRVGSQKPVREELERMIAIVRRRISEVTVLLP